MVEFPDYSREWLILKRAKTVRVVLTVFVFNIKNNLTIDLPDLPQGTNNNPKKLNQLKGLTCGWMPSLASVAEWFYCFCVSAKR